MFKTNSVVGLFLRKQKQNSTRSITRGKVIPFLIVISLLGLILGGCANTPTPDTSAKAVADELAQFRLAGTAWELESLGDGDAQLAVVAGTRPAVNYFVDRYSGTGGCNWFVGVYSADKETLRMETPAVTRLDCTEPPGIMEQDGTFQTALSTVSAYQITDGKLIAYANGQQKLMTLTPANPTPFEASTWDLKFISTAKGWQPLVPGSQITAQFEGDQIKGSSGCNSYSGAFQRNGSELSISNISFTEMACADPAGVMDQETLYLETLQAVAGSMQLGGSLALLNAEGEPIIMFGVK